MPILSQLAKGLQALLLLLEEPRLYLDPDGLELVLEVRDCVLRARVVPDDEAAQRLACRTATRDCALALVRDT